MRSRLLVLTLFGLLVAAATPAAVGVAPVGSIVGWGDNYHGQADPPEGEDFVAIAAGGFHGLALRANGSVAGWGYDKWSQASPPAGQGFVAVAGGGAHSLALRSDGSIAAWGLNNYGQASPPLGDGFLAIAAGYFHSVALRPDGSIVAWGSNTAGQASPPAGNGFVAIAAGDEHNLALRGDGSVVGWGWDYYGQASPPAGTGFVAIAAGGDHSLALRGDGSIVAWGSNGEGQASPPAGNDFVAIAAGGAHSLALRSDGSIVAWGSNGQGQASPPEGNDFVALSAGWAFGLALVGIGPPDGFGKQSPGNSASGQSAEVSLTWGPAEGATAYEYCVDTTDDGACDGWVEAGPQVNAEVGGLVDGTVYFWQVRARNGLGVTEADGGTWWAFTTGPPEALGKVAPADVATGQSGRPSLSWEAVSGADSFEYCLDTINDDACDGWVNAGTATTVKPEGLAYEATYFWQVRAINDFGVAYADEGAWWSFTTKSTPPILEMSFRSVGAYDGWVLERDEDSGKGGAFDATAPTATLGDDDADRQYRSILDFDTGPLPDDAVVVGVTIRIRRESFTGTDPFTTHGMLKVDLQAGAYHGNPALERFDFHAVGSRGNVGRFIRTPAEGWYRAPLRARAWPLISLTGTTQFRLRFDLDDNDDMGADYLSFYTGNASEADRPELIVTYYVP